MARKPGRPSKYSAELAALICGRIAEGESLRQICRDDAMPGISTVMQWLAAKPEFVEQYARAREAQQDAWADEILEIADDGRNDWIIREEGEAGGVISNQEHIQRSKLRVDARKWLMSKLAPKKYGDKVTHSGDPDQPVKIVVETGISRE